MLSPRGECLVQIALIAAPAANGLSEPFRVGVALPPVGATTAGIGHAGTRSDHFDMAPAVARFTRS